MTTGAGPEAGERPPIRSWRRWVVYAAIAVVVGGHARDIITDEEHWPFSPYPMYSYPPPRELTVYRMAGVVAAGEEFPLLQRMYLRPLNAGSAGSTLGRLDRRNNRAGLDLALRECLTRYEALRLAGRHDGPPLCGVRLYRLTWVVGRPDPKAEPDRRELRHEVTIYGR